MARETPAMSSQYDNGVGRDIQEHPLDLTVKKNADPLDIKKVQSGKCVESFFAEPFYPYWYSTYLSLANRQYQNNQNYLNPKGLKSKQYEDDITKNAKRKQITVVSEVHDKRIKLDANTNEDTKSVLREKVKSDYGPSVPERNTVNKSKAVLRSAIASITRQCDCRGCYQNHISKMRTGSWYLVEVLRLKLKVIRVLYTVS